MATYTITIPGDSLSPAQFEQLRCIVIALCHQQGTLVEDSPTKPDEPQTRVPDGYALIGIDVLKAWGKYEELREACRYPAALQPPQPHASEQPEATVGMVEQPTSDWNDPRVQAVYEILCRDDQPPQGEHWEGFQARQIVDALFPKQSTSETETPPVNKPVAFEWRYDSCAGVAINRLAITATPEPTVFLKNVFARGPFPLFRHPQPKQQPLTHDDVRKAGGIVHSDGNIFFKNIDALNRAHGIME